MQNKLQELTDKLYNEGLSKGKQEGEELLAKAKSESEAIVAKAKEQAASIIAEAEKKASELQAKSENDIKMASAQTIAAVKQQVESVITTAAINAPLKSLFSDKDYLKTLINTVVESFRAGNAEGQTLEVILKGSSKDELDARYISELEQVLGKGVELKSAKSAANGFTIGPKDGGYRISFTDEDFSALIGGYLRPATKKILFG